MQSNEGAAQPAAPALSDALVLGIVCVQLVTELAMALGVDEDGSSTSARAHGILGEMGQLAAVTRIRPEAADEAEQRRAIVDRMQRYLRTVAPLMSRLARPAGFDGFPLPPCRTCGADAA